MACLAAIWGLTASITMFQWFGFEAKVLQPLTD
jgi:hypothetical protein